MTSPVTERWIWLSRQQVEVFISYQLRHLIILSNHGEISTKFHGKFLEFSLRFWIFKKFSICIHNFYRCRLMRVTYCYRIFAEFSRVSHNQGRNGYTARENFQGIFVRGQNRDTRDISRSKFSVQFEIVDKRTKHTKPQLYRLKVKFRWKLTEISTCVTFCQENAKKWYRLRLDLCSSKNNSNEDDRNNFPILPPFPKFKFQIINDTCQILYGNQLLFAKNYTEPGFYTEELISPVHRLSTMIHLEMTNEFGQAFFDSFSVTFHEHFYRIIKVKFHGKFGCRKVVEIWVKFGLTYVQYALVGPIACMAVFAFFYTRKEVSLPTSI